MSEIWIIYLILKAINFIFVKFSKRLFRSGFLNITILEAQNRTGGRIRSVPIIQKTSSNSSRGHHVEFGAQWIHGQVANVAYKLANESGLVNCQDNDDDRDCNRWKENYILEGGSSEFIDENITDVFEDIIEKITEKEALEFEAAPGSSWGHFIDETFENHIIK